MEKETAEQKKGGKEAVTTYALSPTNTLTYTNAI